MEPINLKSISEYLKNNSVNISTSLNENTIFNKIGSLSESDNEDLTFFHNTKYLDYLKSTKAKACLITSEYSQYLNKNCIPILVKDPYFAYAVLTNFLFPSKKSNGLIHKSAFIDKNVVIGNNVQIDENVVIKSNTILDNNVIINSNNIIGPNVFIGDNTIVMSSCVITHTNLGKNTNIQPGSIIGGKGFGFTPNEKIEIKHIGNVIIEKNVDIGSNTTIDRGTIDSTVIEENCRIDNLVQIAHNVKIGKNTIIASQTGIAGSAQIGSNCFIGGQVGILGHLIIGNNVKIAGKSGVTKNIANNSIVGGFPARNINEWKRSIIKQYKDIK